MSLNRLYKGVHRSAIKGLNFFALNSRQFANTCRVKAQIAGFYSLRECFVENAMNTLDCFGRKTRFISLRFCQVVAKALNVMSIQAVQLQCTHSGFDVVLDVLRIIQDCHGLHAARKS